MSKVVMTRAKLALLYGALGLMAASIALGNEPQESAAHPAHGSPDSPAPQSLAPAPNDDETMSDAGHVPPDPPQQAGHVPPDPPQQAGHVPPDPPQHSMRDMPYHEMTVQMQMDDTARTGKLLFDQLEWRNAADGNAAVWDAEGWYGGDTDKAWLSTEGERVSGKTQNARADLLWDHTLARWWSVQAGGRQDFGAGPARTWAAIGVQGLAPFWFNTEATFYLGEQGRTAMRLKTEYELLFTQRLILQPQGEANLYGKPDPARRLGSGLSDLEIGLRLRYEVRREFAPYLGVVWSQQFGGTADRVRESGGDPNDVQFVAGLRAWF